MKKSLSSRRLSLLAVTLMCLFTAAQAQDFWSKGIHYQVLEDGTAEVTYMDRYGEYEFNKFKQYKGDISIPSQVTATIQPLYEKPYEMTFKITRIGEYAFKDCKDLRSIIIPATVTTVEEGAFQNCVNLSNVIFRGPVKEFENAAFYGCSSLTSIDLPEGFESLYSWVFANSGLKEISFPSSIKSMGYQAFYGCEGLTEVTIPDHIKQLSGTFAFCTNLKTVHLPNSLEELEGTFKGCTALENVTIPNSVKTLMVDAFQGCTSLTDLVIPNSVENLYSNSLEDCTNLLTLVLGRNVKFANGYFDLSTSPNLYSITSLALQPQPLYEHAFDDDVYRTATLYIPYGTSLDYRRTEYWNKFANIVDLPYSVEDSSIYYMIAGPNRVSVCHGPMNNHYSGNLIIPEKIYIGNTPYDVVGIESDAFRGINLLPNDDLKSVQIPNTVTYIGACAFLGCRQLTEIMAEAVVTINFKAFYGCESLNYVAFGYNLAEISFSAFDGCPELSSMTIKAATPPRITDLTFMPEHYSKTWVHVQGVRTCKAYKMAQHWKNFDNIVSRDYFGGEEVE